MYMSTLGRMLLRYHGVPPNEIPSPVVKSAPPFSVLAVYGGDVSIHTFRSGFLTMSGYISNDGTVSGFERVLDIRYASHRPAFVFESQTLSVVSLQGELRNANSTNESTFLHRRRSRASVVSPKKRGRPEGIEHGDDVSQTTLKKKINKKSLVYRLNLDITS